VSGIGDIVALLREREQNKWDEPEHDNYKAIQKEGLHIYFDNRHRVGLDRRLGESNNLDSYS